MSDQPFDIDAALDQLLDAGSEERTEMLDEIAEHSPGDAQRLARLLAFAEDATVIPASVDEAAPNLFASLADSQDQDRIGTQVGPYIITALISRGGMGVVFRAKRNDGAFQQSVAVKFLPRLAQSSDRRQLFLTERANLARLEHPNIARIIDAGMTADDAPYFVMEYVEGQSLFDAIAGLSVAERLQLFEDLCSAVAYCHQSLVVHGDLKPANVLVANGRLRLLDFGIARLIDDRDGQTPAGYTEGYAAPELLEGQDLSVLSDVYALGALLRDMLEGVSRRGDLEFIVARCTKQDAAERYSSVDALLVDIRAYRGHMPISVRDHDRRYVFGKFLQRNKAIVGGVALSVAALTAGLFVALWQYDKATVEAQRAKETANFVRSLFERSSPELAGVKDVTVHELMDEAVQRLDSDLRTAPDVRHDLMGLIGSGYYGIGDYDRARELQSQVLTYFERTKSFPSAEVAIALRAVAIDLARAGDYAGARDHVQRAADHFFALGMEVEAADCLGRFGLWSVSLGEEAYEAIEQEREILKRVAPDDEMLVAISLTRQGSAADAIGDYETALEHKLEALAIAERMDQRLHPIFITTLCNVSYSYHVLQDWEQAFKVGQECIDATIERYGGEHPDLVPRYTNQGAAWLRMQNPTKARPHLEAAVALAERTLPEHSYPRLAAEANLARQQLDVGEATAARAALEGVVERMHASLGRDNASTARMQALLGRAQHLSGDLDAARASYTQAAAVFETRGAHSEWLSDLALWRDELQAASARQ